jgi:DHA1 family multidrug resistance protein-like MFS transporter
VNRAATSTVGAPDSEPERRGLGSALPLLGTILLGSAGTFLVIPFLGLHLSREPDVGPGAVGVLLAIQVVSSRGLTVVTGPLADRFGARLMMIASIVVIGASYALLALLASPWLYGIDLALMGLGVAAFQPSSKSLLAALADRGDRGAVFAARNVAFNAGAALGGAVGSVFADHASALFVAAGALYGVLALGVSLLLPDTERPAGEAAPPEGGASLLGALRDRRLVAVIALGAGFWFLYSQLIVTVPLAIGRAGLGHVVGLLFTVNALIVILLQLPLTRASERLRLDARSQVAWGGVLTGAGLALVALVDRGGVGIALAFVVVFTVGEMLVAPSLDTLTSELAPERRLGTYFGVAYLGYAIGGTVGSIGGGFLLEAGRSLGADWLPWVTSLAVGVYVSVMATWLAHRFTRVGFE